MLGQPLAEELVSSSVLGKFKLEHHITEGYIFSIEIYYIHRKDDEVIKYKGPGENLVTPEWFDLKFFFFERSSYPGFSLI